MASRHGQRKPRLMNWLYILTCFRQDLAVVVKPVERTCKFFRVARDTVGFAEFSGCRDHGGKLTKRTDEVAFAFMGEQRVIHVIGVSKLQPNIGGFPGDGAQARVPVLHVVDRIV